MRVPINCPKCNHILNFPQELLGKKIRCKRCQHIFKTRQASAEEPDDGQDFDVVEAEEEPSRKAPRKPAKTSESRPAKRKPFKRVEEEEEEVEELEAVEVVEEEEEERPAPRKKPAKKAFRKLGVSKDSFFSGRNLIAAFFALWALAMVVSCIWAGTKGLGILTCAALPGIAYNLGVAAVAFWRIKVNRHLVFIVLALSWMVVVILLSGILGLGLAVPGVTPNSLAYATGRVAGIIYMITMPGVWWLVYGNRGDDREERDYLPILVLAPLVSIALVVVAALFARYQGKPMTMQPATVPGPRPQFPGGPN